MENEMGIFNKTDKTQTVDTRFLQSTSNDRNSSSLSPSATPNHNETQETDDYYEVVSADGSIGGDDAVSDIDTEFTENLSQITEYFENVNIKQTKNEQSSFLDLPFVPKIEFTEESSPFVPALKNSNIDLYKINNGIHRHSNVNINRDMPNFDFSIPPPNYKAVDCADQNFNSSGDQPVINLFPPFNVSNDNRTNNLISKSNDSCLINDDSKFNESMLDNLSTPLPPKVPIADWLDENGDPVKGAFDNIEVKIGPENITSKNCKVEYVFSVREPKNVPVSNSLFLSRDVKINSLTNTNVLPDIVAGNIGLSADSFKVYEEEKKLYLASKSGEEYKASLQANSSVEPVVSKTVADNAKRELLNRFRKNTVNVKKCVSTIDEFPKEEHKKTQEEVALESQAVTEILKDIQRGAARAKEQGALGWQKCPVPVTNKTFLRNTLVSTLREPYRPPSKRGRFHVGLKSDKLKSTYGDNDCSETESLSSRSGKSHSPSGRHSFSTQSKDDDIKNRSSYHRRDKGSWARGSNDFYDTWAAYYGYQWYGPEAYSMYYSSEGWPNDSYMYYGDPQSWQDYSSYFGTRNMNYHEHVQGIRGRRQGRMDSCTGDLRDYLGYPRSRSHSYSRSSSLSRSESCNSRCDRSTIKRHRDISHSKSRSGSRSHKNRKDRSNSTINERNYTSSAKFVSSDLKKKLKKVEKKRKKKSKKHKKTEVKDKIESEDHVDDYNKSETILKKKLSKTKEQQEGCKLKQNLIKHKHSSKGKNKSVDSEIKRKNKNKTITDSGCEEISKYCDMTANIRNRFKDTDKEISSKDNTDTIKVKKVKNPQRSLQKKVQQTTSSQINSKYDKALAWNEDSNCSAKKNTRKSEINQLGRVSENRNFQPINDSSCPETGRLKDSSKSANKMCKSNDDQRRERYLADSAGDECKLKEKSSKNSRIEKKN